MTTGGEATESRSDRSRRTRERLLDATIESLIEVGYARTSMNELCTRAGVSRGAQLHHYPTKAKLMAAAIERLATRQDAEHAKRRKTLARDANPVAAVVELISRGFSGPLAQASLELWTAARTDRELHASLIAVERSAARRVQEIAREFLGPRLDETRFQSLFWLTVNLTRGLAIDQILDGSRRRRADLIDAWTQLASESYGS